MRLLESQSQNLLDFDKNIYSYIKDDNQSEKTAKGIEKNVIKKRQTRKLQRRVVEQ